MTIKLNIPGRPIPWARAGMRGNRHFDKQKGQKESFRLACINQRPSELIEGAVQVDIIFFLKRAKSHFGTGRNSRVRRECTPEHHIIKPDRDNLEKFVHDALSGFIWNDDTQVIRGWIEKVYCDSEEEERTVVVISEPGDKTFRRPAWVNGQIDTKKREVKK